MNGNDCLFVFPPAGEHDLEKFAYALGSGYVAAYLRSKGVSAGQFYSNTDLSAGECAARILESAPKIVGFTVFNTNFSSCLLIAERIKVANPSTFIAFGGPTASEHAKFIVKTYPYVDFCVRNEGEEVFFDLFSRLVANSFQPHSLDLNGVNNVTYRLGDTVLENPDADILRNSRHPDFLDKYPSPYLTEVIPPERAAVTGVITARGCNQNCTFCNCAVLSHRRFTMHSIERVVAEIDYLSYHLKNKTLTIFDDAFTLVPSRAKRICRMLIENKTKTNLSCITRCDHIDDELLDLMKEAGFVSIGVSLESAVPRILRIIGKVRPAEDFPTDSLDAENGFIEKLRHVAVNAKKIGVPYVFSSIMVGLPTETLEEANHTVDIVDSIKEIDTYNQNSLTIYHGTPLYDCHKRYGFAVECIGGVPIFGMTKGSEKVGLRARISAKSNICAIRKQRDRVALKVLSLLVNRTMPTASFDDVNLDDRPN